MLFYKIIILKIHCKFTKVISIFFIYYYFNYLNYLKDYFFKDYFKNIVILKEK